MNNKNEKVLPIAAEFLCFIITAAVLLILLLATVLIPRESIYDNMISSAEYLCESELFGDAVEGIKGSRIDRYADSILLGIAWQYDREDPLRSVMLSAYHYSPVKNENENLYDALTEGYSADRQYLRYWHGSIALVRPLLMFLDLKGIYVFNAVLMAVLLAVYAVVMIRNRAYIPLAGMLAGLVLTQAWFVPLSLEYTWTFILMLISATAAFALAEAKKRAWYGCFFVIAGVATNYFDFLTTETLTLTVPLLLILWVEAKEKGEIKELWKLVLKAGLCWGTAYVAMWILKWGLASVILNENALPYVAEHVEERLGGGASVSLWKYLTGAVIRNLACLFPLEYGAGGVIAAIAGVLAVCYLVYVYRKDAIDAKSILPYAAIAILPYVRFIVLNNHSYLHCFFTYRAQICTFMALLFIAERIIDPKLFKVKKKN